MTEKRYKEEVAEIAKLDPSNIFLPSLREGHTAATEAYLSAAWKIVKRSPLPPKGVTTEGVTNKVVHPEAVNDLFRRKGHINREMRSIKANELMTAATPAERKRIMLRLDEMQSEWAAIQRQIRVWEITKELPTSVVIAHDAEASLQERIANLEKLSDFELAGKLSTARTSLSRKKKQIEKFSPQVMEKAHPQHKQWQKAEIALKEYEREKMYLENEIKRRKEVDNG